MMQANMATAFFFKIHFSSTFYMLGVIYLIQFINYPLFSLAGKENFTKYHAHHIRHTSLVIAFPMLVEIVSLAGLLYLDPHYRNHTLLLIASALLILIWFMTFFISVPLHDKLSKGFDEQVSRKLTMTNWIRTAAWTVRAILLFQIL